jgi:Fe-Mn family superoxide dismutase
MHVAEGQVATRHELPKLPYAMNALVPYLSEETLTYHYGKHHRTYVTKLNELLPGTEFEELPLDEVVRRASGPIFNNAAQVWNHNFYWKCLDPESAGKPARELAKAIDAEFGSFDKFAREFRETALAQFGSGWTWLVREHSGQLAIRNGHDADNPLLWKQAPILTCDVWEHAYYIDYRNDRAKYLDAFWDLVNWNFAERNFSGR